MLRRFYLNQDLYIARQGHGDGATSRGSVRSFYVKQILPLLLALSFLWILCGHAVAGAGFHIEEGNHYYGIRFKQKTIGFASCDISQRKKDGVPVYYISGKSHLRISFLGEPMDRLSQSQQWVRYDNLEPLYYEQSNQYKAETEKITCHFSKPIIYMKFWANGRLIDNVEAHFHAPYFLLDDNNYVQWVLFFKQLNLPSLPAKVNILIPQERINVKAEVKKETTADDGLVRVTVKVQDQVVIALLSEEDQTMQKLIIPEQGIVVEKSQPSIQEYKGRLEASDSMLFPVTLENDPEMVKSLELRIKTKVYGKNLSDGDLTSQRQSFKGVVRDNAIDGVFVITPREFTGPGPALAAIKNDLSDSMRSFLNPEIGIESDDPDIIKAARDMTMDLTEDSWEAAVRIVSEVFKKIHYDMMTQGSAKTTLVVGKGDAGEKAKLAVALCRAAGIPSRLSGGLVYVPLRSGAFSPYTWIEVFMGDKNGWIPMDPTTGQYGRVDATHIRLWTEGVLANCQIDLLTETPLNHFFYSPQAPLHVPGKTMNFRFKVKGTDVGELTSHIKRIRLPRRQKYEIRSKLELDSNRIGIDHNIKADSELYVDELGLPITYNYRSVVSGVSESIHCEYKADEIVADVKRDNEEFSGAFSLSHKTFCLDRNMMTQWALLMSNLHLAPGKRIYVMSFVPQRQSLLPLRIDVIGRQTLLIGNKPILCYACDVFPLGETFYVSMDKQLIRIRSDIHDLTIDKISETDVRS
jgi:hypothetical protein